MKKMIRYVVLLLFIYLPCVCCVEYPNWFHKYIQEHRKQYTSDEMESVYRILKPKHDHIIRHKGGLKLRLHSFSDTHLKRKLKMRKNEQNRGRNLKKKRLVIPSHFDWRKKGYVTHPKVQGSCGGCYCFAAIDNLEWWWKKRTGNLRDLSVQQCIDCTNKYVRDADGCDGGLMEDLYHLAVTRPISLASYDPFKMRTGTCPRAQLAGKKIKVKTYHIMSDEYHSPIEAELASNLIHYGPIPIGIDSKSMNFELYRGGIIRAAHCGKNIDHAVTVVGYTPNFWVVKNSWGSHWGEGGYFRIERGKNACGINTYSSFVTDAVVL